MNQDLFPLYISGVYLVGGLICIWGINGFKPLKRKKMSTTAEVKGLYYVVIKGDWRDKKHYTDLDGAERFAADMARRGYDCEVVILLSRYDHVYAVERTGYGDYGRHSLSAALRMDKETPMNPEYVGEMTPEEEAEWKVVDMQNEARKSANSQAKVGDLIIVHETCGIYFQAGAKAVLTERNDLHWWACFRIPENRPCDYYDGHDAVWCVGDESQFTIIQRSHPTPLPDEAMAGEQEID